MTYIVSVTSDGLNLRERPGVSGLVLDELNHGAKLEVFDSKKLSSGNTWLYVRCTKNGQRGWVSEKYTAKDVVAPPPAPAPEPVPVPLPPVVQEPEHSQVMKWLALLAGIAAVLAGLWFWSY